MLFSRLFKKQNQEKGNITEKRLDSGTESDAVKTDEAGLTNETGEIDEELVAVITAAIQSSYSFDPNSKLVIKSITRTGQSSPLWNRIGRLERINRKIQ